VGVGSSLADSSNFGDHHLVSTESILRDWRFGQVQAERLCAGILHIEGYQDVDPQAPLGGPDGTKDILARKDDLLWLGAVFFPPTPQKFKAIRKKFSSDLAGVERNGATAMAFFVNQHLSVGERATLFELAEPVLSVIYHLERIRSVLDSPKGYGLRLEHLRIPMSQEEQIAFFHALNDDVTQRLIANERQLTNMDGKLDLILQRTTMLVESFLDSQTSSLLAPHQPADIAAPTAALSVAMMGWLHRVVTEDLGFPEVVRGRFRSVQVVVGPRESPSFVPPPPEEIPARISDLVNWWRANRPLLIGTDKATIVGALAELHHRFLTIHPFLDANGRVARLLIDQAARELLAQSIGRELVAEPQAYFSALQAADRGNPDPLRRLVSAALQ
jgi:fido (protein-threonine AMPylation protein)